MAVLSSWNCRTTDRCKSLSQRPRLGSPVPFKAQKAALISAPKLEVNDFNDSRPPSERQAGVGPSNRFALAALHFRISPLSNRCSITFTFEPLPAEYTLTGWYFCHFCGTRTLVSKHSEGGIYRTGLSGQAGAKCPPRACAGRTCTLHKLKTAITQAENST